MQEKVSVVIPARNEAATVGNVVATLLKDPHVLEVIVVDTLSIDNTKENAAKAGARVIDEPREGFGRAIKTGFAAAKSRWIVKFDADLELFNPNVVSVLVAQHQLGVGLVKGNWLDPRDDMPMTRLMVRPAMKLLYPGLEHLEAPNSGIYLFNRDLVTLSELRDDVSADIDVMLRVHAKGAKVRETHIGEIRNNTRNKPHYNAMAETILDLFFEHHAMLIAQGELEAA